MRRFIVPLRVREFPVLVEQVKSVEQLEMGPSRVNRPHKLALRADSRRSPIVDLHHPRRSYDAIIAEEST